MEGRSFCTCALLPLLAQGDAEEWCFTSFSVAALYGEAALPVLPAAAGESSVSGSAQIVYNNFAY